MSVSTGSYTRFTGVLVRRKYWQSHKSFQLIFKTAEGLKLSVTGNQHLVKSLNVGETYRIEGTEFLLGRKSFVKDPIATLVVPSVSFFRRNIVAITIVSTFVFATGTVSAYSIATQGVDTNNDAATPASITNTNEDETIITDTAPQVTPINGENTGTDTTDSSPQSSSRTANNRANPSATNQQQGVTPTPAPLTPSIETPQTTPVENPPAVVIPSTDTPQITTPDEVIEEPYSTDTPSQIL